MKLNASALEDEKQKDLLDFLNKKLHLEGKREGAVVTFNDEEEGSKKITARILKPYIKRFLYNEGIRRDFRVLREKDELRLVKLEEEKEEEESKKSS